MIKRSLVPVVAALAAIVAAVLLLPAGEVQAQDEDTYRFRLTNDTIYTGHIRCGSSGDWTSAATNGTVNITCDGTAAEYQYTGGYIRSITWDCSSENPVFRVRLSGSSSPGPFGIGGVNASTSCVS